MVLLRLVAELAVSLGRQGDARVNPDQFANGKIAYGRPWSKELERGIRPTSVRDASRLVARRRLADQPLTPKARKRKENSLAERIRRAYYRAAKKCADTDSDITIL